MHHHSVLITGKVFTLAALTCLVALIVGVAIFSSSDEPKIVPKSKEPTGLIGKSQAEPETHESDTLVLPGIEKKQDGLDFNDEMKLKLQEISVAYAEQAKYPSYSVPIHTGELATKYLPDMPIATELPADLRDPNSPSLSILPSKFRYFSGDLISASAQISGLAVDEVSDASARLLMKGKALSYATVTPLDDKVHSFRLDFDAVGLDAIEWKEDITIEVEFQLPQDIYTRSITVEYVKTIAQVEDIAASEVKGEYLTIPVYVSTEKPGFHRLQANLYDDVTGEPLVHLTAEEQLLSTSGMLTLKAHISALKVSGSEGPYRLKDLMLRRLPSEPDYITEFGRVEHAAFEVEGHQFSAYQDKPYTNEKAQRIANELRKLGS
jgi:hypothetical protein